MKQVDIYHFHNLTVLLVGLRVSSRQASLSAKLVRYDTVT
jgi:hypothetical protein